MSLGKYFKVRRTPESATILTPSISDKATQAVMAVCYLKLLQFVFFYVYWVLATSRDTCTGSEKQSVILVGPRDRRCATVFPCKGRGGGQEAEDREGEVRVLLGVSVENPGVESGGRGSELANWNNPG